MAKCYCGCGKKATVTIQVKGVVYPVCEACRRLEKTAKILYKASVASV